VEDEEASGRFSTVKVSTLSLLQQFDIADNRKSIWTGMLKMQEKPVTDMTMTDKSTGLDTAGHNDARQADDTDRQYTHTQPFCGPFSGLPG